MNAKDQLESEVLVAAAENGIGSILFRNALANKLGLNLTESLCLTIVGVRGASTPTEVARFTGLTTGSTTTMLDRLEKRGFIRREPHPSDRRSVLVEIDTNYATQAQELVAGIQKAHRQLIESYAEGELKIIADFLNRFTENLAEHSARIGGWSMRLRR